jgi:hypothetical protein
VVSSFGRAARDVRGGYQAGVSGEVAFDDDF